MKNILNHYLNALTDPTDPLILRSAGYVNTTDPDPLFEATIRHLLIFWSIKGTGRFLTDGAELIVPEGHCAIICPPARFIYINYPEDREYCWLTYVGKKVDDYCQNNGLWTGVFHYPEPPIRHIQELGQKIEEANRGVNTEWVRSLATLELDSIANNIRRHAKNKILARAQALTHRSIDAPTLAVDHLASEMGMHRKSLYALCKTETGYSPKEYIKNLRKHKICRLMRYSDLTPREIATSTGFSDSSYFIKAFKKMFGKSIDDFMKHPCCTDEACPMDFCPQCTPIEQTGASGCLPLAIQQG